jgi:hypothetical protein
MSIQFLNSHTEDIPCQMENEVGGLTVNDGTHTCYGTLPNEIIDAVINCGEEIFYD